MNDDQDAMPASGSGRATSLLPPRLSLPEATADPARLAQLVVRAVVPAFADAACVLALEELLANGTITPNAPSAGRTRLVMRRLAAGTAEGARIASPEAFPPGEAVVFPGDSLMSRCLRDGGPVVFTQPDRSTLRCLSPEAAAALGGYTSFLAAPMTARGTSAGVLVIGRTSETPAFGDADARAAADLAARAGTALAGSLALMRRTSVAEALRPPRPAAAGAAPGRLEIAGRCLPAAGSDAGGDWYDLVTLPGGRTGLIIGDVMGHGPEAASVMTRLSATAYALAAAGLPPAEFMRQLNRAALALSQVTLITCAYAVIDPDGESCVVATAGHLPPVLAMPDGTTRVPAIPGGQSLGVTPARYGQATVKLRPGAILCLYTDGLVETRTRPFDQGILALQAALSGEHPDLAAAREDVIAALGGPHEDDITLILARITA